MSLSPDGAFCMRHQSVHVCGLYNGSSYRPTYYLPQHSTPSTSPRFQIAEPKVQNPASSPAVASLATAVDFSAAIMVGAHDRRCSSTVDRGYGSGSAGVLLFAAQERVTMMCRTMLSAHRTATTTVKQCVLSLVCARSRPVNSNLCVSCSPTSMAGKRASDRCKSSQSFRSLDPALPTFGKSSALAPYHAVNKWPATASFPRHYASIEPSGPNHSVCL